jgi:hypothetical protein
MKEAHLAPTSGKLYTHLGISMPGSTSAGKWLQAIPHWPMLVDIREKSIYMWGNYSPCVEECSSPVVQEI